MQLTRLEILDARKNVRAILSAEDNGTVSLRLFSNDKRPIVTLAAGSISAGTSSSPYGALSLGYSRDRPAVDLRAGDKGNGRLSFSSARIADQVTVGYSPFGDFEDGHDRGARGIQIAGPEHTKPGLNIFSVDGVLKGAAIPLEAPNSIHR